MRRPVLPGAVALEGNIGAGKTTLLRGLRARGIPVIPEPVADWTALPLHYDDPRRWCAGPAMGRHGQMVCRAFLLQVQVLVSQATVPATVRRLQADGFPLVVVERSPTACTHVFARRLYRHGLLTSRERDTLVRLADAVGWEPAARLYLRTPPDVCAERVRARAPGRGDSRRTIPPRTPQATRDGIRDVRRFRRPTTAG